MIHDPRGIWIKVDGVTRPEDADAAVEAGVSAVGVIFAPSPRRVTYAQAQAVRERIPDGVTAFGIFDGTSPGAVARALAGLRLDGVQLPADAPFVVEAPLLLRTVRVRGPEDLLKLDDLDCTAVHLDAWVEGQLGGTGRLAPWDVIEAHRPSRPFVLSGGLRPDNVDEAVRRLRPTGVDVSSGVESSPGVKDHAKLQEFVRAARSS